MKKDFKEYLESIGISMTLQVRIKTILDFYEGTFSIETKDIFVNEYLKEDGTREYESLILFSDKYVMEAKEFITHDDFDITPIENRMIYLDLKKLDYDFEKATDKSRLSYDITMNHGIKLYLKASKNNCDYLKEIIKKYVIPNWRA